MLDKKQIWSTFLLEFKMGCKAAETTCNINNAFGPGTANKHTVQWWFKKLCKGNESLEVEEGSSRPSEVDNNQLRGIIKADPHNYTRSCWKTHRQPSYGCLAFEANWKSEKNLFISFVPYSVQFSSVAQSCPTLCDPMNHSMPGLPIQHKLPEFTQMHVHRVGDAILPSHPLSSPSPPAPNPSWHQGLFQWINSSREVAKVLEFQLQH